MLEVDISGAAHCCDGRGGIAEAYYGVPERYAEMARGYLDARLLRILDAFEERREKTSRS